MRTLIDEPRVIKACGEVKATSSELDKFRLAKSKQQTGPTIPPRDYRFANHAEGRNNVRRSPLKAFADKIVTSGEPP
jgi:hypothetical protein